MKARMNRLSAADAIRAFALTLAFGCGVCTALLLGMPSQAHAATLHRTGFSEVPADTVSINYPLKIAEAEFQANGSYAVQKSSIWGVTADTVVYTQHIPTSQALNGSFTLTWRNAGIDDDGDAIDVILTISNIQASYASGGIIILDNADYLCMNAIAVNEVGANVKMDVHVSVLKHDSGVKAAGTMLVAFTDLDIAQPAPHYSEQVELLSGFGNDVWVPASNWLDISADATRFTATQPDSASTYSSGFVTTADTAGFSLRWQGSGCGTYLLMPFQADNQTITATTEGGGSITDEGKHYVFWKNDKTYQMTPDPGKAIADVIVDGKSVGPVSSYEFVRVTEPHTIHVVFEPARHTVTFVDGFGNELGQQQVTHGAAATAPDEPVADSWTFNKWDKDFSNVTEDMQITALWDPVIKMEIPTLVPCTILADGSVLEPSGYAIRNLSPVAMELASAVTTNMPAYGSYALATESGQIVNAYRNGADSLGEPFAIPANTDAPLVWEVGNIEGEQAQELLLKALEGPTPLCDVTFTFHQLKQV